ncbi:MAG: helicase-related protein, partial [bacterium]
ALNLTSASHVIHSDLWWHPAVEAQATDRAVRIGQTKDVTVHRFITKDSFEERINKMMQQKKSLAQMTVATGEQWIGHLSNDEIKDIFQLG